MSRERREDTGPEDAGSNDGTGNTVHNRKPDRKDFDRSELEELHRRATGPGHPPGGPVSWASSVLGVARRTVRRWLAGETRPTVRQVARLRVAARIAEESREIRSQTDGPDPTRRTVVDQMVATFRELFSLLNRLETTVAERASDAILSEEDRAQRRGTMGAAGRRRELINRGYSREYASELARTRRRAPRWLDRGNSARHRARRW